MRIPSEEVTALRRSMRPRDVCLLLMLAQHHYLTTDHVHALFFPSVRSAQIRLRWLTQERHLLVRWRQLEPTSYGWQRRPSLFTLSQRGSAVLASVMKWDAGRLAKRSWSVAEHSLHIEHDMEVVSFFVELAVASRQLPDEGLYQWTGQDTLRRGYQEDGIDLAPDGHGRYLTSNAEVLFFLEWDRGTEPQRHLTAKARTYASYVSKHGGAPVLFVAPTAVRERTIRTAISQAEWPAAKRGHAWTTNLSLLMELGPLGALWLGEDRDSVRAALTSLPAARRSERVAEDCIGKPDWWSRRRGAGEGA